MAASPSEVLRRWFEQVWNAGNESVIDELYGPSAVAHGQPATPVPGPEGFKPVYRMFRQAFPNMHIEVTHAVSEGDLGVVHCRVTGTNTGELMGIAATNRSVDFTGMTMGRVVEGRILEGWNNYDFITMYQQLGVEPPQPV
jgi:predicted ester cyclase